MSKSPLLLLLVSNDIPSLALKIRGLIWGLLACLLAEKYAELELECSAELELECSDELELECSAELELEGSDELELDGDDTELLPFSVGGSSQLTIRGAMSMFGLSSAFAFAYAYA